MAKSVEFILYQLSSWFLVPVLACIILLFLYALYASGGFLAEAAQRQLSRPNHGPLRQRLQADPQLQLSDLELSVVAELEWLRLTSRTAPLLGLVATMIPMGPALAGVAVGGMARVGEQVGIAFAAVIIALLAAALTFTMQTIRRRWRITELRAIERQMPTPSATQQP
jgi:biopolymer transport protein ExbB/TolQ